MSDIDPEIRQLMQQDPVQVDFERVEGKIFTRYHVRVYDGLSTYLDKKFTSRKIAMDKAEEAVEAALVFRGL